MDFVLKGNLCYSESPEHLTTLPGGYVVCINGISEGVFETLPERYAHLPLTDVGDRLVMPGLCDLHVHAPQFSYRGLGMDLELIEWLEQRAFPEESKYSDLPYADLAYDLFVDALKRSATTRASCFATIHAPASLRLMEKLEVAGLRGYVGKVSMNRNSPETLCEAGDEQAAADCESWIVAAKERFAHIKPIITPRFIPSCTDVLMRELSRLSKAYDVPLQSHLSENKSEIEWVKQLCPEADGYADAYDRFGMLNEQTIMAHVVHPEPEEIALLKDRKVMVAHCPASNTNIRSGISPVRKMLKAGVRMGLGTDVAGGHTIDMFRTITDAVQMSKMYWRLIDQDDKALTLNEAFYLATKGGGDFFGKVGSFEAGYELDAIIINDEGLPHPQPLTVRERLERAVYLPGDCKIERKYVGGKLILS